MSKWDEAYNRSADPMKEVEPTVRSVDDEDYEETFGLFLDRRIYSMAYNDSTNRWYETTLEQWQDFIEECDRHPATPPVGAAKEFVQHLRDERENTKRTITKKVTILRKCFTFFNTAGSDGSPLIYNDVTYNEFENVLDEVNIKPKEQKNIHNITEAEMGELFHDRIRHVRDRAIILFQLKLGARAGEVSNARLEDIQINVSEIENHYPEMGTHSFVEMEDPDHAAVYIPDRKERDGNKSKNGRLIPMDDELRQCLREYLLVRPDNGEPWLFLSKTSGKKIHKSNVNEIWKKYFRPEYAETEFHRAVTSHFGRHFFTTWWESDKRDMTRRDIQYLRGDGKETDENGGPRRADSMDEYVHRFYPDIEQKYIDGVFKIGLMDERARVLELADCETV